MFAMRNWSLLVLLAFVGCSNGGEDVDLEDGGPVDGSSAVVEPPSARPIRDDNGLDTRFVTTRTHSAILFHTSRMRKSAVYKNRLISKIDGYDYWVEELPTKYVLLLSDASTAPAAGFAAESYYVMKFNDPFDMKQWLDGQFDEVNEEKALQKQFYSMTRDGQALAAYAPDPETMIFGPSPTIRQLITMLPRPTDFAKRLRHIDIEHDVCFLFQLRENAADFPELAMTSVTAEQKAFLEPIVKDALWMEGCIELAGDPLASLEIEYADAATATAQAAEVSEAIEAGRNHYMAQRATVAKILLLTASEDVMQAIDRTIQDIEIKPKSEMIFLSTPTPSSSLARMLLIAGNQLPDEEGEPEGEEEN